MTGYDRRTLMNAKLLRRNLTDAEQKLWSILRNRQIGGSKFRRQQPIGAFIADFVCHEAKLIVEADGGQHCESARDEGRTAFLNSAGYRVMRFWNNDIDNNLEGVADAIAAALDSPSPRSVFD